MSLTNVTIDLTCALTDNIRVIKGRLGKDCKFMAVVKADAYGHGIMETAKAALSAGADYLAVARPDEGAMLREAGVDAPILVLGALLEHEAADVVKYGLTQTVFSKQICAALQKAAVRLDKSVKVHIKIDTGMSRIGLRDKDEFDELCAYINACENLELEGVFTHFAVSEIEDKSFTRAQLNSFLEIASKVRGKGILLHCANSGAALDMSDETRLDMVRCGIAMYGCRPAADCGDWAKLTPVLSWKTRIVQIKEIPAGASVSYGRRYIADKPRTIATIPVGYGDGYARAMSGKAHVLIGGKRAKVTGTICMDQCMVDVTDIPNVNLGDEAMLIGKQGQAGISAEELATWAGTINYEVLLSISKRVPRIYI